MEVGRLEEIYRALVVGLGDYVRKNRFRHVVMGLSGGIDSALVACIAVDAVGAANVTGVTMPSPYSSVGTRRDAARVARNLGIEFLRLPITGVFGAYGRALAKPFKGLKEDVAEENLQARIRGNYLMALSNKFGWLVLTTGNKSEIGVGYSTLYGDMAGGFAVIKDVPKTLVYEVSAHANARAGRELIPRSIFDRAPSAELRPGPDRPGLAAAVPRARRHPRGLCGGRSEPARDRRPRLRRGHRAPGHRHGGPQRVQAPAGAHRHQDHPARLRQGLAASHRESLPGVVFLRRLTL